jgi:hypothetical protein
VAETASLPSIRDDYLATERRWLSLARGYEFAEQLKASLRHSTSEEPANGAADSVGALAPGKP